MTLEVARRLAEAVAREGGWALLVGGSVRDRLLDIEPHELDIEVFRLSFERLERLLSTFGEVIHVGKAFGVFRVKGLDVDFSLPRRDNKVSPGHTGFDVAYDPDMTFAEAALRRDLTMNAIGLDPLTLEYLDPHGGRRDLRDKRLRATDAAHFPEDPLRGLRVAGFAARFEMAPDAELKRLCSELDLSELSAERVFAELEKLLLRSEKPSIGFELLRETKLLRFFPEVEALVGVPQEPEWHPEGDVWIHTMMVLDEAAKLRTGSVDEDLALMYGALAHDFGKPSTTRHHGGRITSYEHDVKGVPIAVGFLEKLRAPNELTKRVEALVRHHLAPALFHKNGATAKAYRRLARDLAASAVPPDLLLRVATADHLGSHHGRCFRAKVPLRRAFQEHDGIARARPRASQRRRPRATPRRSRPFAGSGVRPAARGVPRRAGRNGLGRPGEDSGSGAQELVVTTICLGYSRRSMRVLFFALLLATMPGEGSENPEARALYEQALSSWMTRTREGLSESRLLFQEAATVDPQFAEAHAGYADASCLLALYGYEAPKKVMPGARESAILALRLDPALAKAHASLGLVRYLYEWSFADAEESFEKAIALDPGYPSAHHWFAMMLMATGRYDESLVQIERAIALEPESALYDVKRGTILMAAGRLEEAEAHLRSVLERRPGSPLAQRELGFLELVRGRPEAARGYLDASEPAYALVLVQLGRRSEARAMLEALRDVASSAYVSPVDFALVHVGLGETEAALDELERAFEEKDAAMVYLRTQPGLASIRSEARFQDLLKRMGL